MAPDKLLAEWFWTDRWMGSSAFLLPLEARGLYREMLTQAWRRGAMLPNDHQAIQRAVGVTADEWARCWPLVESYWRVEGKYLINDTQLAVYADAKARQEANAARALRAAQTRKEKSPSRHDEVMTKSSRTRDVLAPSPSPSPSLDLSLEPSPKKEHPPACAGFEQFWAAYPRKVGKADAERAWQRKKPDLAACLSALAWQVRSEQWTRDGGQFIPHPATWLNQGRWADEPATVQPSLLSPKGEANKRAMAEATRIIEARANATH